MCSNVLSNSANYGIIPQSDFFDRSIANSDNTDTYYVIEGGDFVYNPRKSTAAPYGPINVYEGTEVGIISPLYLCFKVEWINKKYLYHYFKSNKWHPYMYINGDSGARHDRVSIKDDVFLDMPLFVPSQKEQLKITLLLDAIDKRIETQKKIIEDLKKLKDAICISQLKSHYETEYMIGDLCKPIAAKQYISADITAAGAYPIIQQGENPIAGYTESMPFMDYKDVILFGDHTLSIYRPKAPFLLSTDGIKILKPNDMVNRDYLYYLIYTFMPEPEGYKRYYSILKDIWVPVPHISTQKSIVGKLLSIDSKIEIEARMLELQFQQKQYLLASMFI